MALLASSPLLHLVVVPNPERLMLVKVWNVVGETVVRRLGEALMEEVDWRESGSVLVARLEMKLEDTREDSLDEATSEEPLTVVEEL